MADDDEARQFAWLWTAALLAGCGCLVLLALYYWRHKERTPWTDFAPRENREQVPPVAPPGANGSVGDRTAPVEEAREVEGG